jgi:hypothetical protein
MGGSLRADARPLVDSPGWAARKLADQSPWTGRAVGPPFARGDRSPRFLPAPMCYNPP